MRNRWIVTILIISRNVMFAEGLKKLVGQRSQFQIIGQAAKVEGAVEQINELQPDLVIVDTTDTIQPGPNLDRILHARSDMTVIGLSLQNNDLYIYQATHRTVFRVDDLLDVIDQVMKEEPGNNGFNTIS